MSQISAESSTKQNVRVGLTHQKKSSWVSQKVRTYSILWLLLIGDQEGRGTKAETISEGEMCFVLTFP